MGGPSSWRPPRVSIKSGRNTRSDGPSSRPSSKRNAELPPRNKKRTLSNRARENRISSHRKSKILVEVNREAKIGIKRKNKHSKNHPIPLVPFEKKTFTPFWSNFNIFVINFPYRNKRVS